MILIIISFQKLLVPGWVRKLSALILKNVLIWYAYIASDSQSPVPGFQVAEMFGSNRRRSEGKNVGPLNNQCFGQVEFESG